MPFMLTTLSVTKPDISSAIRPEQPANIPPICFTCSVSNPVTFRLVRLEQEENILSMSVTLFVSKPVISKEFRPEHPRNMLLMSVMLSVFQLLKFSARRLLHSANIPEAFCTWDTSHREGFSVVRLLQ